LFAFIEKRDKIKNIFKTPMAKIFIVIPAYNEEKVIGKVITDIKKEGYKNIIVVDDGSVDKTKEVAKKKGATVLRHILNLGQGAAIETGLEYCRKVGADIVVTFDADGQFKTSEIKKVIEPIIKKKVDVVLGSRFLGKTVNIPFLKKLTLKAAVIFTDIFSNIKLTDTHNGFRAFSKNALKKIFINHSGMAHASDIIDQIKRYNLKYQEVPVTVFYTDYSLKKGQSIFNSIRILLDLLFEKLK
jgi:glycosyltransferase involved in cell wall biosynthesis